MNLPGIEEIVDNLATIPQAEAPQALVNIVVHCECVNPDGSIAWTEDVPVVAGPPALDDVPLIHGPPPITE